MRGPAKLATYLGIAMVLGGFALIVAGWNGAAGLNPSRLPGQFPYLLSGGLSGLGLISAGAGVLFVQAQRELDAEETQRVAQVVDSLRQTVSVLRGDAPAPARAVATPVRATSSTVTVVTAGEDPTVVSEGDWAPRPAAEEALVVVGRSSFHDPACHLVSTRDDLDLMRREEAVDAGLKPCRVCKP